LIVRHFSISIPVLQVEVDVLDSINKPPLALALNGAGHARRQVVACTRGFTEGISTVPAWQRRGVA